jgi:hypothetical protein
MLLTEILERKTESFLKEKNDNLIQTINFLVDESDNYHTQLENLLSEIETQPIEDDYFFKNVKKEDYKKRAVLLEEMIFKIEKKWSELILILNERYKKS